MMGLRRESLPSRARTAGPSGSLFDHVAGQLSALISRFGLQEQRRPILDAYEAIGRDSLAYPRRARPLAASAINHDGTPFQYALTLGVPSRMLAFLGEAGPLDGTGAQRMANNRRRLTDLARSLGTAPSLAAVEELLDALAPADNTVLLGEPAGAFWIGVGFALGRAPRLKIYINGRWGKEADRWQRLDRFATFFGLRDRWHGLAKELRAHLKPLGMALTFSSSRPPDGRIYLSAFGKTIAYYEHLARTAGTTRFNNDLHQFAGFMLADDIDFPTPTAVSSFGLRCGSAFDYKFELCAHCLFESDRQAAHRLRSWLSAAGIDAAAYEDMLAVLQPAGLSANENNLHCYAGIGLKRGAPCASIYLKPGTMPNGPA
jgi:hypothetical protein